MKLELLEGADGKVTLNYWDWERGEDRVFHLLDGNAYEVRGEGLTEVDLASTLPRMLVDWKQACQQ